MAKLPEPPTPAALRRISPDITVLPAGTELWRIYFRGGRHPTTWNQMRDFGPLPNARFDHHDEPPRIQERKIVYTATGAEAITTCVAEVFQQKRLINTYRNEPWLACFALTDDVPLLDLTGKWPTRAGASMKINSGPRPRTRRWSRAIYAAYPDVCGLLHTSSMHANKPSVVLYERAEYTLPMRTTFNEPLSHVALLPALKRMSVDLGYDLV